MYGISTCLVLVLIVMGVSMMNNFSKMKSLQNKINVVAEGEKQTSSPDVKETSGAAATVEKNQEAADTEKESAEITEENEGEEQTEDKIQKVFRFPGLPLQQMKMMVFMWWKKEIPLQLSVKKCMEMLIM